MGPDGNHAGLRQLGNWFIGMSLARYSLSKNRNGTGPG